MISKPALVASFRLSFGLLCCVPGLAFGQNAVSKGTKAGFRMYYPNSNDWWLDPSHGNLDFRVNGQAAFASFNSSGYLGIGTTSPDNALQVAGLVDFTNSSNASTCLGIYAGGTGGCTGTFNTAVGYQAFGGNGSGYGNTVEGSSALYTAGGNHNTAIGYLALYSNSGSFNIALGAEALFSNQSGGSNIAEGENALYFNTTGSNNVAVGYQAGAGGGHVGGGPPSPPLPTSFSNDTLLGYQAGQPLTSGSANTIVGANAGRSLTSGSNNIIIGADQDLPTNPSYFLNIGGLIYGNLLGGSVGIGTTVPTGLFQVGAGTMTVLSSGNVGVGTTSPAGKLDVNGTICLGGTCLPAWPSGASPAYGASGSARAPTVYADAGGNVGIGTTSPSFWLDVRGGGAAANGSFRLLDADAGGGSLSVNTFSAALANAVAGDALVSNTVGSLLISPNAAGKDLKFVGGTWSNPVSMVIRDGGYVGIGTTSPASLLNANVGSFSNANSATAGMLVSGDATGNPGWAGYRIALNNTSGNFAGFVRGARTLGTTFLGLEIGAETNHGIRFLTNGTSDAAERMRIDPTGSVGIGTTSPIYPLHIKSGGSNDVGFQVDGTNTNSAYLTFMNAGGRVWIGEDNSAGNNLAGTGGIAYNLGMHAYGAAQPLQFTTNGAVRMTIRETGSVGIGTTAPTTKLSIAGLGPDASGISLTNMNPGGRTFFIEGGDNSYHPGKLLFRDVSGGADQIMALDGPTGNVGIGTTNPGQLLEVEGSAMLHGASQTNLYLATTGNFLGRNSDGNIMVAVAGGSDVDFSVAGSTVVVIKAAGNVGIGTANPQNRLAVQSPIIGGSVSVGSAQLYLRGSDNGYGVAVGALNTPAGAYLQTMLNDVPSATPIPLFLNPSGGSVGIGTTSPQHTLDVNGAINGTAVLVNGVPVPAAVSAQTIVAPSARVLGQPYQNPWSTPMFVAVSVNDPNASLTSALSDSSPFPTNIVATVGINTGGTIQATTATFQLFFIVLPGNYYIVSAYPGTTVVKWTEWH